ncbi:MAG: RAMP superfamily CRISPR-associated protein [Hyphomicrobiales bacterium]
MITATFELVTPMFLGDANSQSTSLRPTSIKSEILFWWRSLRFGHLVDERSGDIGAALLELHRIESALFGSPGTSLSLKGASAPTDMVRATQSKLSLSARWVKKSRQIDQFDADGEGIRYLGYGVVKTGRASSSGRGRCHLERTAFENGGQFRVQVATRFVNEAELGYLENAVRLMGLLGGLGARRRRGWGSLCLVDIEAPGGNDVERLFDKELQNIVAPLPATDARDFPLAAFGRGSSVHIWTEGFKHWTDAMESLGHGYQLYRSWGSAHSGYRFSGIESRKNFLGDHDWFRSGGLSPGKRPNLQTPKRANLGLPLSFGKKTIDAAAPFARRASPIMFHIAKVSGKFHPVATHLDNAWLPEADERAGRPPPLLVTDSQEMPFQPDPTVVENYFNGWQRTKPTERYSYFDGYEIDLSVRGDAR